VLGRLHVITDVRFGRDPCLAVPVALGAGADVIQVRVKGWSDRCLLDLVEKVVSWCEPYGATCIVNDRVDVVLAVGAGGVHLGADDLPVATARRLVGANALVGGRLVMLRRRGFSPPRGLPTSASARALPLPPSRAYRIRSAWSEWPQLTEPLPCPGSELPDALAW
jgi:hypothetical protein